MGKRSWSLGFEVCVKVLRAYCNCFIRLLPFFFLNIRLIRFITFCPKSLTLKKKKSRRGKIYFFSVAKISLMSKKKKKGILRLYIYFPLGCDLYFTGAGVIGAVRGRGGAETFKSTWINACTHCAVYWGGEKNLHDTGDHSNAARKCICAHIKGMIILSWSWSWKKKNKFL